MTEWEKCSTKGVSSFFSLRTTVGGEVDISGINPDLLAVAVAVASFKESPTESGSSYLDAGNRAIVWHEHDPRHLRSQPLRGAWGGQ